MWLVNVALKLLVFGGVVVLVLLAGIPLCTWVYVGLNLSRAGATVLETRQEIDSFGCGSWRQTLRLRVNYPPVHTRALRKPGSQWREGLGRSPRRDRGLRSLMYQWRRSVKSPSHYTKGLAEPLPPAPDVQRSASAVVKNIHHVKLVGARRRVGCYDRREHIWEEPGLNKSQL